MTAGAKEVLGVCGRYLCGGHSLWAKKGSKEGKAKPRGNQLEIWALQTPTPKESSPLLPHSCSSPGSLLFPPLVVLMKAAHRGGAIAFCSYQGVVKREKTRFKHDHEANLQGSSIIHSYALFA